MLLHMEAKTREATPPFGRVRLQPVVDGLERCRLQFVEPFSTLPSDADEAGVGEGVQVLRHCLPGDGQSLAQFRYGQRALAAEPLQQRQPRRIRESKEDARRLLHWVI